MSKKQYRLTEISFYYIISVHKPFLGAAMAIELTEVKRRLLALLKEQTLVDEYILQYGPVIDIKHIWAIKETHNKDPQKIDDHQPGEDPIFTVSVKCPICNQENIICYELRAKSQQITQNKFLVPIYEGALGFKTVDYTLIAVTVCPRCLFASPDRKDFGRHEAGTHSDQKSQLTGNVLITLQEKIGERKAIVKDIENCENHFKRPRTYESQLDSYKLSVSRAKVEAWYELPYAFYKLGAYSLRIAKILKDHNVDNQSFYVEALHYFEEAFRTSNCPSEEIEMQVIYLICALYLKVGDQKKANSYIGVFNNLHNARVTEMRTDSKLNTTIIDKWSDKAKNLWEDRDSPELFKDE